MEKGGELGSTARCREGSGLRGRKGKGERRCEKRGRREERGAMEGSSGGLWEEPKMQVAALTASPMEVQVILS